MLILALMALALLLSGCRSEVVEGLVRVTDAVPEEAEQGDRLEITGEGFPQGKEADVRFSGQLHKPGQRPVNVALHAKGTVLSPSRLEVRFTDELVARFCGRADAAVPATFRGNFDIAFTASGASGPLVVSSLKGRTLSLRPPTQRAARTIELERASAEFLRFAGTEVDVQNRRLSVRKVNAGSPAEQAGLLPGDTLVSIDGMEVRVQADLVPATDDLTQLVVLRGTQRLERPVSVAGLHPHLSPELERVLRAVALFSLFLLALFFPGAAPFAGRERALSISLHRSVRAGSELGFPPRRLVPYALGIALVLLLGGASVWLNEAGLVLLLALAIGARLLSSVRTQGLRGLASAIPDVLLLLFAAGLVADATGALRIAELSLAQGVLPSRWNVHAAPALMLTGWMLLMRLGSHANGHSFSRFALGLWAGTLVVLFGGAFAVENMAFGPLVTVLLFGLKSAVVALWASHRPAPGASTPGLWARLRPLGLCIAALALHLAWTRVPLWAGLRDELSIWFLPLSAALALRAVVRVGYFALREHRSQDSAGACAMPALGTEFPG
jgi:hypothetical protein